MRRAGHDARAHAARSSRARPSGCAWCGAARRCRPAPPRRRARARGDSASCTTAAGSAPSRARDDLDPGALGPHLELLRSRRRGTCRAATSTVERPSRAKCAASLPASVVLPTPLTPDDAAPPTAVRPPGANGARCAPTSSSARALERRLEVEVRLAAHALLGPLDQRARWSPGPTSAREQRLLELRARLRIDPARRGRSASARRCCVSAFARCVPSPDRKRSQRTHRAGIGRAAAVGQLRALVRVGARRSAGRTSPTRASRRRAPAWSRRRGSRRPPSSSCCA